MICETEKKFFSPQVLGNSGPKSAVCEASSAIILGQPRTPTPTDSLHPAPSLPELFMGQMHRISSRYNPKTQFGIFIQLSFCGKPGQFSELFKQML
jgi:hypothetical protein